MNAKQERLKFSLILLATAVWGAFGPPAFGQNPRLDIQTLESISKKASEVVDVNLDGPMLKLAARFMTDEDDREGLEIVKNLKGIYVKSFEFEKPGEYSPADVETIRSQLHGPYWSRIVTAQSKRDSETTEVYLMTNPDGGAVLGLAVIDAEAKELTVVNIVGPIDIDELSRLEGKMGIPRMGDARKESAQKQEEKHGKEK